MISLHYNLTMDVWLVLVQQFEDFLKNLHRDNINCRARNYDH